jgi:hypothetical protein
MLTREQHLAMARCLKSAKKKLYGGRNPNACTNFVCIAVDSTNSNQQTKTLVSDWIDKQLNDTAFITTWAYRNGVEVSTYEQCQAYRHAWVDHMIKVLES